MSISIPFSLPTITGDELSYLQQAVANQKYSGEGPFNKKCEQFLATYSGCPHAYLTPSGTASLEMAMITCGIRPGDEVILPSYTFSSTANAVLIAGGTPVFIDCKPDDMNMDENLIEGAITQKTKMIFPMHYAGAACEMDRIIEIAKKHNLHVVSDGAQAILSKYKNQSIEKFGDISTLSFHDTKNISCGEGGAIFINGHDLNTKAEIIREKGTNRKQFLHGLVDKYTWHDIGSSYLMSEFAAAFLMSQLTHLESIILRRVDNWNFYHQNLKSLSERGYFTQPKYAKHIQHNGHIYFIVLRTVEMRKKVQTALRERGTQSTTHYVPLHSAPAGIKYGKTGSSMRITDDYADRLLRLPLYHDITRDQQTKVIEQLSDILSTM